MTLMRVANSIIELIGSTPMVKLNRLVGENDAAVLVKLESFNPSSSVKDRTALNMVVAAEKEGRLKPGDTIIEPTSGNTGIGLAMVAAAKGYQMILVMPETMSVERRNLMKAFGAEVILTPGGEGMEGAVAKAEELAKEKGYFLPQQFTNLANPEIHRLTTAQEILTQTGGKLDAFVAGVGSGGTVTGVGEILKQELKNVRIVAVEPKDSSVLSGGKPGVHKIQGLGAGFIPEIINSKILDQIIPIANEEALEMARRLASEEGILAGVSSGAAVAGALQVAKELGAGRTVVVIAPDTGERYLSTELFKYE